jgi:metal-responsive CopG/Arc/MetJ family transcriptional regulator
MPLARTTISIEKTTLDRFFRAYPAGKRSQIIQRLIEQDLDPHRDRLARAAEQVETNSEFQTIREDGERWELATAVDGLDAI